MVPRILSLLAPTFFVAVIVSQHVQIFGGAKMLILDADGTQLVQMNRAYCYRQNIVRIIAAADGLIEVPCLDYDSAKMFVRILFAMDVAGVRGLDLAKVCENGIVNLDSEILREFELSRPKELSAD
jgi:hypothetical protein